MAASSLRPSFLTSRILSISLLLAAGWAAVRALQTLPAARQIIDNAIIGGFDALPAVTQFLLKHQPQLLILAVLITAGAVSGVWLARTLPVILSTALISAVVLLLEAPAVRHVPQLGFMPAVTHFKGQ